MQNEQGTSYYYFGFPQTIALEIVWDVWWGASDTNFFFLLYRLHFSLQITMLYHPIFQAHKDLGREGDSKEATKSLFLECYISPETFQ